MADAVVIGAGPNGLVAANRLADAGWEVVVLEAEPDPGGAVRSAELTLPGYVHDRFSAFYPLAAGSLHIAGLGLERHGLRWLRAPVVVADPAEDGSVVLLSSDREETCASVEAFAPGDGLAWRELSAWWDRIGPRLVDALLDPFPPLRKGGRLVAGLGARGTLELARFALLSARRFADERFNGAGAAALTAALKEGPDRGDSSAAGAARPALTAALKEGPDRGDSSAGPGELRRGLTAHVVVKPRRTSVGELRCELTSHIDANSHTAAPGELCCDLCSLCEIKSQRATAQPSSVAVDGADRREAPPAASSRASSRRIPTRTRTA